MQHLKLVVLACWLLTACAPATAEPTATRVPPTVTLLPTASVVPPTEAPISPTADFAPGVLHGVWTRADPERGQLYLTFTATGGYLAAHGEPGGVVHSGAYTLEDRVLTFVDGWRDCETGSYVASIRLGQTLLMRELADPSCGGDRVNAFNNRRWDW